MQLRTADVQVLLTELVEVDKIARSKKTSPEDLLLNNARALKAIRSAIKLLGAK